MTSSIHPALTTLLASYYERQTTMAGLDFKIRCSISYLRALVKGDPIPMSFAEQNMQPDRQPPTVRIDRPSKAWKYLADKSARGSCFSRRFLHATKNVELGDVVEWDRW